MTNCHDYNLFHNICIYFHHDQSMEKIHIVEFAFNCVGFRNLYNCKRWRVHSSTFLTKRNSHVHLSYSFRLVL